DGRARTQLVVTIRRELDKLAARVEADAIILVDTRGVALVAAGGLEDRWPAGRPVTVLARANPGDDFDGVIQSAGDTFRVVTVPLQLEDGVTIGSLHLATALDRRYAEQLDRLVRARTAVVADGAVIATTLSPGAAREFEVALASGRGKQGTIPLDGASHAY